MARIILESYDDELAVSRDTRKYRDKGRRKTSIKTIWGEVEYRRRVYRTTVEDGSKAYIYLLDQAMQMDRIGLISTNLVEKIAQTVTEPPYRVAADTIKVKSLCITLAGHRAAILFKSCYHEIGIARQTSLRG